jgi:FkbM family methyltransferase
MYRRGLVERGRDIVASYLLDSVKLRPGDRVVDCGANYGDLFLGLRESLSRGDYIWRFEPGPGEYRCLCLNAPAETHYNFGLGDADRVAAFYVASRDADSSFLNPPSYDSVVEVPMRRLDDVEGLAGPIRILKIEAEGFEPEVLAGAGLTLCRCDYVAIAGILDRRQPLGLRMRVSCPPSPETARPEEPT